jgi:hypothetical protein
MKKHRFDQFNTYGKSDDTPPAAKPGVHDVDVTGDVEQEVRRFKGEGSDDFDTVQDNAERASQHRPVRFQK